MNNELLAANTQFSFKLFSELRAQYPDQNIFISPASIAFALAMTYNGARGETQHAMAHALQLPDMRLDEVNRANAALRRALTNSDAEVELAIANALWARQHLRFKPAFVQGIKDFYNAEVGSINFDDPKSPAIINAWVSRQTHDKITQIVDQIPREAMLFLINAVYFKGKWKKPFDAAQTRDRTFTLLHGRQKLHPMMTQSGRYSYYQGPAFQAVNLPYGENSKVSLYVFLPNRDSSLMALSQLLTAENWQTWIPQFRVIPGMIVLPRFKIAYEVELNEVLKALGMGVAFDEQRADFEGMLASPPQLFISKVKHKTFAEVNEEGTEAAAVTSVEMFTTSAPAQTFRMIIDRPFLCAIRDNTTGTLLFLGAILEPE